MKLFTRTRTAALLCLALAIAVSAAGREKSEGSRLPRDKTAGKPELVFAFRGPMPTGVTVSHRGRIFVNFPRWGDKVEYTVAEVRGGKTVAYPDAGINEAKLDRPADCFVSVQSVVVD